MGQYNYNAYEKYGYNDVAHEEIFWTNQLMFSGLYILTLLSIGSLDSVFSFNIVPKKEENLLYVSYKF